MKMDNSTIASDQKEILFTRVFDAPRELVWEAWTKPGHIARWWGPNGYTVPACKLDFREGGKIHLDMQGPDGNVYPADGVYREISKPEKIVIDGIAEETHPCGGGLPPRAVLTITFAEQEGKTFFSMLTQFESKNRMQAANDNGYSVSWEMCFDRFGEYLASL